MRSILFFRNIWSHILYQIPLNWLNPIRKKHESLPLDSMKRKLFTFILKFLRYRQIEPTIHEFKLAGHSGLRFINANTVITRTLFWLGQNGYEGNEAKWWEYFCSRSEKILEIGANIGFYTILGARAALNSSYISVEPHPTSVEILRKNLSLNKLTNVEVINFAVVGNKLSDTAKLSIPIDDFDVAPTGAYLKNEAEGFKRLSLKRIEVKLIEASKIIKDVDLIKLDVEGNEWNILSKLSEFVETNKPTIFIEILTETPKLRRLLFDWHKKIGYKIYIPNRNDLLLEIPAEKLINCDFFSSYGVRDVILSTSYK